MQEKELPKLDLEKLAATPPQNHDKKLVQVSVRIERIKRDALLDTARRRFGMTLQELMSRAIEQLLSD